MRLAAFLLLSCLSCALVLAFPADQAAIAAAAAADIADAATEIPAAQLREPRHLLKKLFEPQVIVQPIIVQPPAHQRPYYPYGGEGRGYGGYGDYGYKRPYDYWH
ncbi:uncharacterized protein LOC108594891 [Drosophila busckii]|uniref:uncharacterized protein LOC108594891 n=1 Tax=Drosophila busckii TaxID=30019 RepID=UPI00083F4E7B|nr:uncharacterized protein LOC108594891 [Drosophila busckii]